MHGAKAKQTIGFLNIIDICGLDNSLLGECLCIEGCLAASLASTYEMPVALFPPLVETTKNIFKYYQMSPGGKVAPGWEPLGYRDFKTKKIITGASGQGFMENVQRAKLKEVEGLAASGGRLWAHGQHWQNSLGAGCTVMSVHERKRDRRIGQQVLNKILWSSHWGRVG